MEPYLFYGKILPERAEISLSFELNFPHLNSGDTGKATVSIIHNQLVVTVYTKKEWDIFDLRNVVKNIVLRDLSIIGYLRGYAYDLEITRVLNVALEVDRVFGIDIPCIVEFQKHVDLKSELKRLRTKSNGRNGVFLNRCFGDLISAMKHADDTRFNGRNLEKFQK